MSHFDISSADGLAPLVERDLDGGDAAGFAEFQQAWCDEAGSGSGGGSLALQLLKPVDNARVQLDDALVATAQHATPENMHASMAALSRLDLAATFVGKIADKATKGLDRILNLQ